MTDNVTYIHQNRPVVDEDARSEPAERLLRAAWARCDHLEELLAGTQREVHHLQVALESNRDIGVAIGILMAADKVTRQAAFEMLRTTSQHQNRKLRAIAADVIETGELPV